jgi:probable HAF family extracellular repeat protein
MSDLGTLTGGDTSWAFGINDDGRVVGTSNVTGGDFRAFIWENGTMYDLNDLLDPNDTWELRWATDVNNDGEITGWGTNPSSETRALLLTQPCGGAGPMGGWGPDSERGTPAGITGGEGRDEMPPTAPIVPPLCGAGVVQFGLLGAPALIGVGACRRGRRRAGGQNSRA